MADMADTPAVFQSNLLSRRGNRNLRRLTLERLTYIGRTLHILFSHERKLCAEFAAAPKNIPDAAVRIPLMCQLVKTLDVIHDRRRILVGDPLPRGGGQKPTRQLLEMEPGVPEPSVPEPAKAEPGAGLD